MFSLVTQYLKVDKTNRKENNGADSHSDSQSSVSDSTSTAPPPLHRSQELPRKPLEPFHLHSFPKVKELLGKKIYILCSNLMCCIFPPNSTIQCTSVCLPPEGTVHKHNSSLRSYLRVDIINVPSSDYTIHLYFYASLS